MKLQLTVFAQDLQEVSEDAGCNPFAVIALLPAKEGGSPVVLGKTETLRNNLNPDFTKIFTLDYELGKLLRVLVTVHDARNDNQSMGSAIFDMGTVLGTKGGIIGKQVKSGGYIMVHVERSSGMGSFNFQLRGWELVSKQEQVDPYFEIQKKRKTTKGETVWDVIFRSLPIEDSSNPLWTEASIDFGSLCDGDKKQKVRISVKDYDDSDDTLIGSCVVTIGKLLNSVIENGNATEPSALDLSKALVLKRPRPLRETGKILVCLADVVDAEKQVNDDQDELEDDSEDEEKDIVVEATDDIEILPDDISSKATFADYVGGGCQLKVIVGIDYTASNGKILRSSESFMRCNILSITYC